MISDEGTRGLKIVKAEITKTATSTLKQIQTAIRVRLERKMILPANQERPKDISRQVDKPKKIRIQILLVIAAPSSNHANALTMPRSTLKIKSIPLNVTKMVFFTIS